MRVTLLFFTLLFAGCVTYPRPVSEVKLGSGTAFTLLPPHTWQPVSALQKITVQWNKKSYTFNVQLEISPEAINIVGLTPVFSRSFFISYSQGILDYVEHPYFRYPVRPENMLADFQMAFAPGNSFKTEPLMVKNSHRKREFFSDNELIVSISYSEEDLWGSMVTLTNHLNNYNLKIETLQVESL